MKAFSRILFILPAVLSLTINSELCSADNMYCYDEKTESIIKVGAHSVASGRSHSSLNSGSTHSGPSCKVVGYTEVTPAIPSIAKEVVKVKEVPAAVGEQIYTEPMQNMAPRSLLPMPYSSNYRARNDQIIESYEHDPRKYLNAHINILNKPIAGPGIPMAQILSSGYAPERTPVLLQQNPAMSQGRMYVSKKRICFDRPKQQYLSVKCCKTTMHPVALPKEKHIEPCICPDGFFMGQRYLENASSNDTPTQGWIRSDLENLRQVQRLL